MRFAGRGTKSGDDDSYFLCNGTRCNHNNFSVCFYVAWETLFSPFYRLQNHLFLLDRHLHHSISLNSSQCAQASICWREIIFIFRGRLSSTSEVLFSSLARVLKKTKKSIVSDGSIMANFGGILRWSSQILDGTHQFCFLKLGEQQLPLFGP